MAKPWSKSKTIWFNAIMAGLGALEASAGVLQPYIDGNVYAYGFVLLSVGNAVLRIVTNQGLKL